MEDYEIIIGAIIFAIANIVIAIIVSNCKGTAPKIITSILVGLMVFIFTVMAEKIGSAAIYICGFGLAQVIWRICKWDNNEKGIDA